MGLNRSNPALQRGASVCRLLTLGCFVLVPPRVASADELATFDAGWQTLPTLGVPHWSLIQPPSDMQHGPTRAWLSRAATVEAAVEASESADDGTWRHWRSMAEMAAFLGGGAAWYWIDIDRNLADWDELSVRQRFSWDAVRTDNNDLIVNYVSHPLFGGAYYVFARSNQLSIAEAAAYSLVTSTLWEYGLEFNERTSYNDAFVTPGAGIAVGEAWYSIGLLLNARRSSLWGDILAWTVGFPVAFNRLFDDQLVVDQAARARALRLAGTAYYAVGDLRSGGARATRHTVGLQSEVIKRESLADSGSQWFADGDWTRLWLAGHAGHGVWGAQFGADTVIAGLRQDMGNERVMMLGTGIGFEYAAVHLGPWKHQHALLHLGGAFFKVELPTSLFEVRLGARLTPDFSATNSLGYPSFSETLGDERGKSILRKQGYYYGWGWSGRWSAELWRDPFSLGVEATYGEVDSLDGLDRSQEELTVDERAFDSRDNLSGFVRLRLAQRPWGAPYVELHAERERRRSKLETISVRRSASEISLRLGTEFW